ncbi:MAG: hypothetical protein ABW022_25665 [Actinoplanes sp.]
MPIAGSDIIFRLSVVAAAGDATAGTPAGALGDQVSTTTITTAQLNSIFDDVSGAEAAAGDVEYRCIFVLNNHASLTLTGANVYIVSQTSGGGLIELGLDPIAVSAKASASAQAATIANESTAPASVTFSSPTSGSPLVIGDMAPGTVKGIWMRRTVTAGAGALNPDGVIIGVAGDTLP